MAAWNELLAEFDGLPDDNAKTQWLNARLVQELGHVSSARGGRNVILYGSAFLQKPGITQQAISLTGEEINGFMSVMFGMNWSDGLTLILHTPGGVTNAAETIVSYLHSKFTDIEVLVPTYAMSAGTMIALGAQRVIMGRQSQLGPIDPQLHIGGRFVSGGAIVDQFEAAKTDILANQDSAHVWAPILQSMGPALLVEAKNALHYSEKMVEKWMESRMFSGQPDAAARAATAATHFNDSGHHKSHGRRINRGEAQQYIETVELEMDQSLQDAALTAYHVMTISFEKSAASKLLYTNHGRQWVKNSTK